MRLNIVLFLFLISSYVVSQNKNQIFIDSISNLSLKELDRLTLKFQDKDTLKCILIARKLVRTSKSQNSINYLARGYETLYLMHSMRHLKKRYADSMLFYAKQTKNDFLLSEAHYRNANANYFLENYREAIEHLGKSYALSLGGVNPKRAKRVEVRMASIKNILGRYSEANSIYKNTYNQYDSNIFNIKDRRGYLSTIYNLAQSYNTLRLYDTASVYIKKGSYASDYFESSKYQNLFQRLEGIYLLGKNENIRAIEMLKNSQDGLSLANEAESLFFIGKAFNNLKKKDSAIHYYKKADLKLKNGVPHSFYESKTLFKQLHKYYHNKSRDSSYFYLTKFFEVDSLRTTLVLEVGEKTHELYELPKIRNKERIVSYRRTLYRAIAISLLVIIVFLVVYLILQRRSLNKQKVLVKRFLDSDQEPKPDFIKSKSLVDSKINKDKVNQKIAIGLEKFFDEKLYLNKDITLPILSKELGTNTSDLSNYFNKILGVSFPDYLKRTRINNAVEMLKENKELLKYSINGLADEFGFGNPDTFSRAFKKITGIKPSVFLGELKKRSLSSDNL